jgi:hypothetical protein
MLAFIPWGYFARRYLGPVSKLILSIFFGLLSLLGVIAGVIAAAKEGFYDIFWAFVVAFAFCALCSYWNWQDAGMELEDLKFWKRKSQKDDHTAGSDTVARRIAEEVFGHLTHPSGKQKK